MAFHTLKSGTKFIDSELPSEYESLLEESSCTSGPPELSITESNDTYTVTHIDSTATVLEFDISDGICSGTLQIIDSILQPCTATAAEPSEAPDSASMSDRGVAEGPQGSNLV